LLPLASYVPILTGLIIYLAITTYLLSPRPTKFFTQSRK